MPPVKSKARGGQTNRSRLDLLAAVATAELSNMNSTSTPAHAASVGTSVNTAASTPIYSAISSAGTPAVTSTPAGPHSRANRPRGGPGGHASVGASGQAVPTSNPASSPPVPNGASIGAATGADQHVTSTVNSTVNNAADPTSKPRRPRHEGTRLFVLNQNNPAADPNSPQFVNGTDGLWVTEHCFAVWRAEGYHTQFLVKFEGYEQPEWVLEKDNEDNIAISLFLLWHPDEQVDNWKRPSGMSSLIAKEPTKEWKDCKSALEASHHNFFAWTDQVHMNHSRACGGPVKSDGERSQNPPARAPRHNAVQKQTSKKRGKAGGHTVQSDALGPRRTGVTKNTGRVGTKGADKRVTRSAAKRSGQ